jgi:hypothetical protein
MGFASIDAVVVIHPQTSHRHPASELNEGQVSTMFPNQGSSVELVASIARPARDDNGMISKLSKRQRRKIGIFSYRRHFRFCG